MHTFHSYLVRKGTPWVFENGMIWILTFFSVTFITNGSRVCYYSILLNAWFKAKSFLHKIDVRILAWKVLPSLKFYLHSIASKMGWVTDCAPAHDRWPNPRPRVRVEAYISAWEASNPPFLHWKMCSKVNFDLLLQTFLTGKEKCEALANVQKLTLLIQ